MLNCNISKRQKFSGFVIIAMLFTITVGLYSEIRMKSIVANESPYVKEKSEILGRIKGIERKLSSVDASVQEGTKVRSQLLEAVNKLRVTQNIYLQLNEDGDIISSSTNIFTSLDWKPEELVGKKFNTLIPEHKRDEFNSIFNQNVTTRDSFYPLLLSMNIEINNRMDDPVPCRLTLLESILKTGRSFTVIIEIK